jgi:hypothetical protein
MTLVAEWRPYNPFFTANVPKGRIKILNSCNSLINSLFYIIIFAVSFELDKMIIDEILFHMENQDGEFVLDSQDGHIEDISEIDSADHDIDFHDTDRFISLPNWTPSDGFRLMEKFSSRLKNPIVR